MYENVIWWRTWITLYLFFSLGFLDQFSAYFDAWGENSPCEICHIDALQVTHLLGHCKVQDIKCRKIDQFKGKDFTHKPCALSINISLLCHLYFRAWWPVPGSSHSWTRCYPAAGRLTPPSGSLKWAHRWPTQVTNQDWSLKLLSPEKELKGDSSCVLGHPIKRGDPRHRQRWEQDRLTYLLLLSEPHDVHGS